MRIGRRYNSDSTNAFLCWKYFMSYPHSLHKTKTFSGQNYKKVSILFNNWCKMLCCGRVLKISIWKISTSTWCWWLQSFACFLVDKERMLLSPETRLLLPLWFPVKRILVTLIFIRGTAAYKTIQHFGTYFPMQTENRFKGLL